MANTYGPTESVSMANVKNDLLHRVLNDLDASAGAGRVEGWRALSGNVIAAIQRVSDQMKYWTKCEHATIFSRPVIGESQ